jgi:nicotinamidase-related amidase
MNNIPALLIIDAQVNMFMEGSSVFEGEKLLHTIRDLIAQARAKHIQIIFIQNNGRVGDPDVSGTEGWQIHPAIPPGEGEIVIQKYTPDSFFETNLQSELSALHINRLIIAGMQTEMCIDATCRRARQLGYDVTLVKDAHSTFDGTKRTAAQIIDQYNDTLSTIIKLEEARNILFD